MTYPKAVSDSDLLDRLETLTAWRREGKRAIPGGDVDTIACRAVDRASRHLRDLLGIEGAHQEGTSDIVGLLLAHAYPDRIAKQREPGSDRYLLANGRGGRLSPRSAVRDRAFLVAVNMDGGERGDGTIHQANAVTPEMLRSEFSHRITRRKAVVWDGQQERVVAREEECYHAIVLSSSPFTPHPEEVRAALLRGVREGRGLEALSWSSRAAQFLARMRFLARHFPEGGWPDLSTEHLVETLDGWLGPYLPGVTSLAELGRVDILPALKGLIGWELARKLEEGAPTHLQVPSGSCVQLHYPQDGAPVLAVKLQELFGLAETPTVAWGRVPVLLHLLSPAQRPIQVTQDLKNFWNTVYPEVKRELKGRYPKHPWPDDPWNAVPTKGTKKREKS